jgi:hypothetical protein
MPSTDPQDEEPYYDVELGGIALKQRPIIEGSVEDDEDEFSIEC